MGKLVYFLCIFAVLNLIDANPMRRQDSIRLPEDSRPGNSNYYHMIIQKISGLFKKLFAENVFAVMVGLNGTLSNAIDNMSNRVENATIDGTVTVARFALVLSRETKKRLLIVRNALNDINPAKIAEDVDAQKREGLKMVQQLQSLVSSIEKNAESALQAAGVEFQKDERVEQNEPEHEPEHEPEPEPEPTTSTKKPRRGGLFFGGP